MKRKENNSEDYYCDGCIVEPTCTKACENFSNYISTRLLGVPASYIPDIFIYTRERYLRTVDSYYGRFPENIQTLWSARKELTLRKNRRNRDEAV